MLHLINPHNFYSLGCRKKTLSQPFFRFGFGASRSILSQFFDLNGFTLGIESSVDFDPRIYGSKAKDKFVDGHGCT